MSEKAIKRDTRLTSASRAFKCCPASDGRHEDGQDGSGNQGDSSCLSNTSGRSTDEARQSSKRAKTLGDPGLDVDAASRIGVSEIVVVLRPHQTLIEKDRVAQTRLYTYAEERNNVAEPILPVTCHGVGFMAWYIKMSGNATVGQYLAERLVLEERYGNGESGSASVETASEKR